MYRSRLHRTIIRLRCRSLSYLSALALALTLVTVVPPASPPSPPAPGPSQGEDERRVPLVNWNS